jgi:hypothetical protein
MLPCVAFVGTDVSEGHITSIIRVTRISELVAVTTTSSQRASYCYIFPS